MSRCDLDLWPLDFEFLWHFGCHAFKLCTKCKRNGVIHGSVIDDLARFRCPILGVGHDWQTVIRGAWTQLHQTLRGHRAIIPTQEMSFSVRIFCCIFKRELLKVELITLKTTPIKCRTFWPPVNIRGGVGEISIPMLKLYLWLNLRTTFDGHPLRGCWAHCIDKKNKKKRRKFMGKA